MDTRYRWDRRPCHRQAQRPGGPYLVALLMVMAVACNGRPSTQPAPEPAGPGHEHGQAKASDPQAHAGDGYADARRAMVAQQIRARGIRDPRVLAAMEAVPRHRFVPAALRDEAHGDHPLPIGHDQTISQPYIVALMTELAQVGPGDRVLEVGTGCGYQAAVLAELGAEVYSIEIVAPLAKSARARLETLGYRVHVRHGDGYRGWPEHAPFDAVVVTAAPPEVPEPLRQQLAEGGRLVIPVGDEAQTLITETKLAGRLERERVTGVRFVPMTGEARSGR